jgi:hypothetical protein
MLIEDAHWSWTSLALLEGKWCVKVMSRNKPLNSQGRVCYNRADAQWPFYPTQMMVSADDVAAYIGYRAKGYFLML